MLRSTAIGLLLALSTASVQAVPYAIDKPHTQVWFNISHLGYSELNGQFRKVDGQFDFDPADVTKSSISIKIPVDSIDMNDDKLNTHLKSPDFFDSATFPALEFKSTKVEKTGGNALKVTGNLSMHGITKLVTLEVKINKIGEHPMLKVPAVGFTAKTSVKRSDFGIKYGIPAVSDELSVYIAMEAQKSAPTVPPKS